ncbi:MAG: nucleoside 2-deoxyribosyltransferase [Clostridia bacterium]|nr:nucleoside 2-deoxyribosyltransferase [Clostridia bacterium]
MKKRIYLANGLFSIADRKFNEEIYNKLKEKLGEDVEIYAPQFNLAINDKTKSASSIDIYNGDTEKLEWANILLAVLDGEDLGVATEIGFVAGWNDAYRTEPEKQKIIVGIYTDNRDISKTYSEDKNKDMQSCGVAECQYPYINLYTVGAVKNYGKLFAMPEDAIDYISKL